MEVYEIILIATALSVVAADILIRLRIAPGRRDGSVEQLLSVVAVPLQEQKQDLEMEFPRIANSLLKHFAQSFASRQIVDVLAAVPGGVTEKELEQRFTRLVERSGKRTLPVGVLRKVIMILMGADFVQLSGGKFRMTEQGRALHSALEQESNPTLDRGFA